ncbi:MAG TPA: hypothetical protein VF450_07745 [Noviherbaspirillum sp.]
MRTTLFLLALYVSAGATLAQDGSVMPFKDDVPLSAYLDALERIAPAARIGADAYLDAFRRRCGHALETVALRRAIADGSGDPVLMAMMLAASRHDTASLRRLSGSVSCDGRD